MRLLERSKQPVTVYPFEGVADDAYAWGPGVVIRAAVYPASQKLERCISGERVKASQLLLYDGGVRLKTGMGVAIGGGEPAWRIVSLEGWTHQRAALEAIGEGGRGYAES